MRAKGDLTLFLVAALWGSAFAAQRIAGVLGSVYFFNGARFLLASLILFSLVRRVSATREQWLWMCAAGIILFSASAFQQAGIMATTAGNAGFITSLYVIIVPFIMLVGWKEKTRWTSIMAVLLAGAGAFLLSTSGLFQFQRGDLLELVGAFFWACHVVLLGKYASKFESLSFSSGQLAVAGLLSLLTGVFFESPSLSIPLPLIGAICYTAVISLSLGYTLQIWAQKLTPPTDAAIILSLESVFSVLGGWLVLHERLVPMQFLGCVLILSALILSQLRARSKIGMEG